MKKFLSVFLAITMIFTLAMPAFAANTTASTKLETATNLESAFVDGDSLIVFVTGIGQSFSYLFDESYTEEGAFENGTLQDYENYAQLIADGKHIARWNLFNNYFDEAFSDTETIKAIIGVVFDLITTLIFRTNMIEEEDLYTIISNLFKFNTLDDEGNHSDRVVTPRYTMPISQYPENAEGESEARNRFYGSIPCAEVAEASLGENYEDYIYCFNYNAFSYTKDNVADLDTFIDTILEENTVGADKVVLVPMSMGASVVSAYLYHYKEEAKQDVKRVVSIVGCWEGSDVVYDLVTLSYADNSADLLYNGLLAEMLGEPAGYLVNFIIRIFAKAALRDLIDMALGVFVDVIFLNAPSLVALVPTENYEEIRDNYLTNPNVVEQADYYYAAQSNLKETLNELDESIGFSFITGYGLPYGAETGDYKAFGFMKHAATTNSDEIINISSTAPGTVAVTPGTTFEDTAGRELSPDGSLDISGTYYKNSTWFFFEQKHELEYNNTALSLALNLALGTVKTVEDCDNLEEDGYLFPQFNESRNLKSLKRSYIPDLNNYMKETGYTLTASQQALYDEVIAMTLNTVHDRDKDDALIEKFRQMLIEIGVYEPDEEESTFNKLLNGIMSVGNDLVYGFFGAQGFGDVSPAFADKTPTETETQVTE